MNDRCVARALLLTAALTAFSCGGTPTPAATAGRAPVTKCGRPASATPTVAATAAAAAAAPADFAALAAAQAAANTAPGERHVPARDIPVPTHDVSAEVQKMIARPYGASPTSHPKDAAEWKALVSERAEAGAKRVTELAAKVHVTITPKTVAGVPCFQIVPGTVAPNNAHRLLVNVHGGAYVFGPGISGTWEGVLLAAFGGFEVLAIDYRMPPDFPYPAALDDAMAVWKTVVTTINPRNTAIFGSSTGGALTLAMALRARDEHLPLPAAMAPGTPWSDLTDTGDSYRTNEWLDNGLVTWNGRLGDAARLYAAGHDMKDPYLSPVYGDLHGLPPAILTTGTRDLFLSNTVRVHRKLRRAGVEADLNVYEGQSHGNYNADPDAPETKEAMTEIAAFFDRHLGQ